MVHAHPTKKRKKKSDNQFCKTMHPDKATLLGGLGNDEKTICALPPGMGIDESCVLSAADPASAREARVSLR